MAKCPACGAEIEPGMKFCGECGARVPQSKKCPQCGNEFPLSVKFCGECGYRFPVDGSVGVAVAPAAPAIGDKNVIAGDVRVHSTTTNYINQDATKQVVQCVVCGRAVVITEALRCAECGGYACAEHYLKDSRRCTNCHTAKVTAAEAEFRKMLEVILEDGIIDQDEFVQLEQLRKRLGISSNRALEIQTQMKQELAARNSAARPDTPLMPVEKAQCERAKVKVYDEGDFAGALKLVESIRRNHPLNEEVLAVYLAALMGIDEAKAASIVSSMPVDLASAYVAQVDLEIRRGDLAAAEVRLAHAERLWPESVSVKYRRIELMYATAAQLGDNSYLAEAMDLLISMPQPTDKLESSWNFYLQYSISRSLGDDVPELTSNYCHEEGVYCAFVRGEVCGQRQEERKPVRGGEVSPAQVDAVKPARASAVKPVKPRRRKSSSEIVVGAEEDADYATIAEALTHVPVNGTIILQPGNYKESLVIDRDLSIIGQAGTLPSQIRIGSVKGAENVLKITANVRIAGVTLGIDYQVASPGKNSGAVLCSSHRSVLEHCIIDGKDSGVVVRNHATAVMSDCEFRIGDGAKVYAVYGDGNSSLTLDNCSFLASSLGLVDDCSATVRECSFKNGASSGAYISGKAEGTLERCRIDGYKTGVFVRTEEVKLTIKKTTIVNCSEHALYFGGKTKRTLKTNKCNEYNLIYKGDIVRRIDTGINGKCTIKDPTSYSFTKEENFIKAARFQNDTPSHTGDLFVSLWMVKDKYNGGKLDGICVARGDLGIVEDGYGWSDRKVNCERLDGYRQASGGDYYATIIVQERTVDGEGNEYNYIIGWNVFNNKVHWN